MTRAEARTKWCPMARISVAHQVQQYDNQNIYKGYTSGAMTTNQGATCVADKCMMWRTPLNDPDNGHCGLAGYGS